MLRSYIKTAWRNLIRTRTYSSINILGLAVGLAACILILHYVEFERSYDRFHPDFDRIYRLRYERTSEEGTSVRFASCCPPAADFIRGAYPEIEEIARIYRYQAVVGRADRDVAFTEDRMYFAEPEFLRIFDIPFLAGDPLEGIREPGHAFMSLSTAGKYFHDEDPVGRTFTVDGKTDYTVVGVFEDRPANSHLKFDILLSFPDVIALRGREVLESWGHTGFFTYLKLKPGSDPIAFERKMADLIETKCSDLMKAYRLVIELKMQPLTDIHLTSHFMQEYEINGSRSSVDFLSIIALFIIVMAWVNTINLSTARSLTRAREVGLRKTVGATRLQLVFQFHFETVLLHLFAVLLSLPLIQSALPLVRGLTGTPAEAGLWSVPWFWRTLLLMFLGGVFFSGLYPAAAMSAFRPAAILRGRIGNAPWGVGIRKALVVFQFAIALALLAGTVTVFKQIAFMKNSKLGFDRDRILVVKAPRVLKDGSRERFKTFKQEVLRNPGVLKACVVTEVPGRQIFWDAGGIYRGGDHAGRGKNYLIVGVDEDFVDVFGLRIVRGRNFSEGSPSDSKALILNQTAVAWMGFESEEEAVGEPVDYWGVIYTVVGILSDFHQQSPKAAFEPHIFRLMPYAHPEEGRFALKLGPGRLEDTVRFVGETYENMFPGNPVEYFFLDDYFDQQYIAEERMGRVIGSFSLLALIVTGLGIFGISSFLALQRRKEIGIRKILGATTGGIVRLLTGEFTLLVGISAILAAPPVYWGIRRWLDSFAVRMTVDVWLLLIPLLLVLASTGLTIGTNVLRAASADPVKALKHE